MVSIVLDQNIIDKVLIDIFVSMQIHQLYVGRIYPFRVKYLI